MEAAGDLARGATLYVTLEPCCHHGKTPPCTDAILRSGIHRVVAAMSDPFPRVAGKGAALLQSAGVEVTTGICELDARRLNAPYLKLLATAKPWVHAKWAMTLDGKIASRTGDSKWISNEASRRRVHELRGTMDAIIVGIGTVLADDPQLTARPPGPRIATRVLLDSSGRLPTTAALARTAKEAATLVVTSTPQSERVTELEVLGCEVIRLAEQGRPSVTALLAELGRRGMTNVLVEGGAGVLGAFFDAMAIDEFHVFIAPRIAGGSAALSPVGGLGVDLMARSLALDSCTVETIAGDTYIHGFRTARSTE